MTKIKSIPNKFSLHDIENLSKSALMQDIFYKTIHLAKLDSNVILVGEIGAGKHRFAKLIHENSNRSNGPFHTFNCLNLDEDKYKNAFWGHLKKEDNCHILKYDLFEKTISGTLYLDKFSTLSTNLMLNIVSSYHKGYKHLFQNRDGKKKMPRLIISFNQELYHQTIRQPSWEKLLNELNPVMIMLPPLREHKEDIPLIINYFLEEIRNNRNKYKNISITPDALIKCFNYDWPGNFLQLKNAILQGAILSDGKTIKVGHLPFSMSGK